MIKLTVFLIRAIFKVIASLLALIAALCILLVSLIMWEGKYIMIASDCWDYIWNDELFLKRFR